MKKVIIIICMLLMIPFVYAPTVSHTTLQITPGTFNIVGMPTYVYDWIIIPGLSTKYLTFNGSHLRFNETYINITIDARNTASDTDTLWTLNTTVLVNQSSVLGVNQSWWDGIYIDTNESVRVDLLELSNTSMDSRMDTIEGAGYITTDTNESVRVDLLYLSNATQSSLINLLILSNVTMDGRVDAIEGSYITTDTNESARVDLLELSNTTMDSRVDTLETNDPNDYDAIGDIPTATPSDGDTTHFSLADEIYDWVIGLGYLTTYTDDFWSLTGNYLYNNSGNLAFNETYLNKTIDARNADTNESVRVDQLELSNTSMDGRIDTLEDAGYITTDTNESVRVDQLELSNTSIDTRVDTLETNDPNDYDQESDLTTLLDDNYADISVVNTNALWTLNTSVIVNQSSVLGVNQTWFDSTYGDTNESARVTQLELSNTSMDGRVDDIEGAGYITTDTNESVRVDQLDLSNTTQGTLIDLLILSNATQATDIAAKHTPGTCSDGEAIQNTTTDGVECITVAGVTDTNESVRVDQLDLSNTSQATDIAARHIPGVCGEGEIVQNTTTGGVDCLTISLTDTNESVRVGLLELSNVSMDARLDTIEGAGYITIDTNESERVTQLELSNVSMDTRLDTLETNDPNDYDQESDLTTLLDDNYADISVVDTHELWVLNTTVIVNQSSILGINQTWFDSTYADTNETTRVTQLELSNTSIDARVDTIEGAGYITTDTNESTRFDLLRNTDCGAGDYVYGVNATGGLDCREDVDTDTTYTNGTGLTLVGTTLSLTDLSSQSSEDNSGRTYIQDIVLDAWGRITGITSATETITDTDTNAFWTLNTTVLVNQSSVLGVNQTWFDSTYGDTNESVRVDLLELSNITMDSRMDTIEGAGYITTDTNESVRVDLLYLSNATQSSLINLLILSNTSQSTLINAKALPGVCSEGEIVQNTTTTGVECVVNAGTDTNESTRFDLLRNTDCGSGDYVYGVNATGGLDCREDIDTDTNTNELWTLNTTVLVNQSSVLGVNQTWWDGIYGDTNESARVDQLELSNTSMDDRVDTLENAGYITTDTNESVRVGLLELSNITMDSRMDLMESSNTTQASLISLLILSNTTQSTLINAKALPGICGEGEIVQNTTTTGVECVTNEGIDTNESVRFDALRATDCSSNGYVYGINATGGVDCREDINTNELWTLNTSVLVNQSGTLGIVQSWWDAIYGDTNESANVLQLNNSNTTMDARMDLMESSNTSQSGLITQLTLSNTTQSTDIALLRIDNTTQGTLIDLLTLSNTTQAGRITQIEFSNTSMDSRVDTLETNNDNLKNTDCAVGDYVYGINATGGVDCSTPSGSTDTNETGRFDNLTSTDCSSNGYIYGINASGGVDCREDLNTNELWTFNTTVFINQSGTLGIVQSWWDGIYADTNESVRVDQLDLSNETMDSRVDQLLFSNTTQSSLINLLILSNTSIDTRVDTLETNDPNDYDALSDFTTTLTDTYWCRYKDGGTEINCDVEPFSDTWNTTQQMIDAVNGSSININNTDQDGYISLQENSTQLWGGSCNSFCTWMNGSDMLITERPCTSPMCS